MKKEVEESVCTNCGKVFVDNRTPEERLIDAIFAGVRCPTCMKELIPNSYCVDCGDIVSPDKVIYFNGKPYHPKCLPYRGKRK